MNRIFSGVVAVLLLVSSTLLAAEEKWRVHEWGTFTSLQDETGAAIGGINTDDEPVPHFVHRLANFLLLQPLSFPSTRCTLTNRWRIEVLRLRR